MKKSSNKSSIVLIVKFCPSLELLQVKLKIAILERISVLLEQKLTLETGTSQYLSQRAFSATIIPLEKCHSNGESKLFETLIVFLTEFLEKVKMSSDFNKSMKNYQAYKDLS